MDRSAIFGALYALLPAATWAERPGGFSKISDRYVDFAEDTADQPVIYQTTHHEHFAQQSGLPYRVRLTAMWTVHYQVAEGVSGDTEGHHIMDALQALMAPKFTPGEQFTDRCTLGGLAYHVLIDGQVLRDGGSLDGQGVIVIPISILVP